jgi:predicted nuclease of predicted toxin-antitoxin system
MSKTVLSSKKGNKGEKKFKVDKGSNRDEKDVEIEIDSGGSEDVFIVEKLDMGNLELKIGNEDIVWFNNFQIKKESTNEPINQNYKVKINGLSYWRTGNRKIVIQDGNVNGGKPYVFTGTITDDTINLSDGDPGVGGAPPGM